MSSRRTFMAEYCKFIQLYGLRNYEECLAVFSKIDLQGQIHTNEETVEVLLTCALNAIQQVTRPANARVNEKVAALNGFETVLRDLSEKNDYEKFFLVLGLFGSPKDFVFCGLSCFADIDSDDSDLQSWLKAVNQYLIRVLQKANFPTDNANLRKELYVKLTGALLIFSRVEKAIAPRDGWRFGTALNFINSCQKLPIFEKGKDVQQYKLWLQLLNDFLLALSSQTENEQMAAKMETVHEQLRSLTKSDQLGATLVENNYITLSTIIKMCESRLVELVDSNDASSLLKLLVHVALYSSKMKIEKPSCSRSCYNAGIHSGHEVMMVAANMYLKLMGTHTIDEVASEEFFSAIVNNMECISKLRCETASNVEYHAIRLFKSITTKSKTKEEAKVVIPFVKYMLKRVQKIKSIGNTRIEESDLFQYLFNALETIKKWGEAIDVGYWMLAFRLDISLYFDAHVLGAVKKQQKLVATTMKTPYDFFEKASKETLYGVKLSENFNVHDFSLAYLRIGFRHDCLDTTLAEKIAHQILTKASGEDAPLKFAFSIHSMNFNQTSDKQMKRLVKKLQPKANKDRCIAMQIAAIEYLKFKDECKLLSLNNNIFHRCTPDDEKRQIEQLRPIKKVFVEFVEFFVGLKTYWDRNRYADEKYLMLRELKTLGKLFIIRGLIDDGFNVFMALYNLAKSTKDNAGLIDSCSCFAENRAQFMQKYPNMDMNAFIKEIEEKIKAKKPLAKAREPTAEATEPTAKKAKTANKATEPNMFN